LRWVAHKNHSPEGDGFHYARAARLKSSLDLSSITKFFVPVGHCFLLLARLRTPAVRLRSATRRNDSRVAMIQINLLQVVSN
jgi:hypothetical protein